MRAGVVQLVNARVDLAAHGVARHGKGAADARRVRGPGHRVERRGPKERQAGAACQALRRRDADAHARERTGAAADEDGVEIAHRETGVCQRFFAGRDELDVGPAAALVVAGGEDLDGGALHARDGAGEHIGRGIESEDDHDGSFFAGFSAL